MSAGDPERTHASAIGIVGAGRMAGGIARGAEELAKVAPAARIVKAFNLQDRRGAGALQRERNSVVMIESAGRGSSGAGGGSDSTSR